MSGKLNRQSLSSAVESFLKNNIQDGYSLTIKFGKIIKTENKAVNTFEFEFLLSSLGLTFFENNRPRKLLNRADMTVEKANETIQIYTKAHQCKQAIVELRDEDDNLLDFHVLQYTC